MRTKGLMDAFREFNRRSTSQWIRHAAYGVVSICLLKGQMFGIFHGEMCVSTQRYRSLHVPHRFCDGVASADQGTLSSAPHCGTDGTRVAHMSRRHTMYCAPYAPKVGSP